MVRTDGPRRRRLEARPLLLVALSPLAWGSGLDTGASDSASVAWTADLGDQDQNLLLPDVVALDGASGRGFVYSNVLGGALAAVDLASGTLLGVTSLPAGGATIEVDDSGMVWAWNNLMVTLYDPVRDSSQVLRPAVLGLDSVSLVKPVAAGDTWVLGTLPGGGAGAVLLDRLLRPVTSLPFGFDSSAARSAGSDVVALLRDDIVPPGFELWNLGTLSVVASCAAPFTPKDWLPMNDGNVAVATGTEVGVVTCVDGQAWLVEEGVDNVALVGASDRFIALSKSTEAISYESEARVYTFDPDMVPPSAIALSSVPAGLAVADGAYAPATGMLWAASENSSSLVGVEVAAGVERFDIELGTHVEAMTYDPEEDGRVFVTQRLNSRLARIEQVGGEATASALVDVTWPVAPLLAEETLWVVDQLTGNLHGFDAGDGSALHTLELPFDPSTRNLTFADLELHPERGTMLLSWGPTMELTERSLETGEVEHTWPLQMAAGRNTESRLEIVPFGDVVYVVSTVDRIVERLDLSDGSSIVMAELSDVTSQRVRLQDAVLSEDGSLLYVGPHALDGETLERLETLDRTWTYPVAALDGCWLAWSEPLELGLWDADGEAVWTYTLPLGTPVDVRPMMAWSPEWQQLLIGDVTNASVIALDVDSSCPG